MKPKLTIAHLIASNFFGGPEKQILTHGKRLDPRRFRFVLVSFVENGQPNALLAHAADEGLETVALEANHPFNPLTIARLVNIITENQVDILCSHGYKANVLGRLATWMRNTPHIAISRGWTAESRKIKFYEWFDKLFLRFADHVVAVSVGQQEKILGIPLNPKRVSVIHNAIALDSNEHYAGCGIRSALGITPESLIIVSAGRLSPEKNHAAMIAVAQIVCATRSDVYFAVFGEGVLRPQLEGQISAAGLSGRFFLPGFRKDLQTIFREIDIFMLPSFTEGLPNVVLEAFAANKPVVATAVGGTPEVVQDGISGFLTTPDDIAGMAEKLLALLDDKGLRKQMGASGYRYVAENFDFESQTRAYEKLYSSIAQKRLEAYAKSQVGS